MAEITISHALMADWEAKLREAMRRADEATREATMWQQKIAAARLILSEFEVGPPTNGTSHGTSEGEDNMTAAIESIANSLSAPISRSDMKDRLRERGFPEERLANYFYTAVGRLKGKNKITVTDDKKIGPSF